jgi:hypothetical protein
MFRRIASQVENEIFAEMPNINMVVSITPEQFNENPKEIIACNTINTDDVFLGDFLMIKEKEMDITICASRYNKYRDSMAKAHAKYRESNREKINAIAKHYYDTHKEDAEWKKRQSEKSKRAYYRKKQKDFTENTLIEVQL